MLAAAQEEVARKPYMYDTVGGDASRHTFSGGAAGAEAAAAAAAEAVVEAEAEVEEVVEAEAEAEAPPPKPPPPPQQQQPGSERSRFNVSLVTQTDVHRLSYLFETLPLTNPLNKS